MTLKTVFTGSLLDDKNERKGVEQTPACLFIMSQGTILDEIPISLFDRQATASRLSQRAATVFGSKLEKTL